MLTDILGELGGGGRMWVGCPDRSYSPPPTTLTTSRGGNVGQKRASIKIKKSQNASPRCIYRYRYKVLTKRRQFTRLLQMFFVFVDRTGLNYIIRYESESFLQKKLHIRVKLQ